MKLKVKLGLGIEIFNKKNNSGKVVIKYKSLEQFELISKNLGSNFSFSYKLIIKFFSKTLLFKLEFFFICSSVLKYFFSFF